MTLRVRTHPASPLRHLSCGSSRHGCIRAASEYRETGSAEFAAQVSYLLDHLARSTQPELRAGYAARLFFKGMLPFAVGHCPSARLRDSWASQSLETSTSLPIWPFLAAAKDGLVPTSFPDIVQIPWLRLNVWGWINVHSPSFHLMLSPSDSTQSFHSFHSLYEALAFKPV
jgi:hypothetical protein